MSAVNQTTSDHGIATTGARKTKGELTSARILDAAQTLFAERGFDGTSLRDIARAASIREPGLYNYFKNKEALYAAVLDRALEPMSQAMNAHLDASDGIQAFSRLPAVMTDLLLAHPQMASLFQQALRGDPGAAGNRIILDWLDRLFREGLAVMQAVGHEEVDHTEMALQTIAMFNLCTGYFLSQRAFDAMGQGAVTDPDNIARQKRLLGRLQRALLIS